MACEWGGDGSKLTSTVCFTSRQHLKGTSAFIQLEWLE